MQEQEEKKVEEEKDKEAESSAKNGKNVQTQDENTTRCQLQPLLDEFSEYIVVEVK